MRGGSSWKARDHLKSQVVGEWLEEEKKLGEKGQQEKNHMKDPAGSGGRNLEGFLKPLVHKGMKIL